MFLRLQQIKKPAINYLLSIEGNCWIFSIIAFVNKYLNINNKKLIYLKEAAYTIYIVHIAFLYLGSTLLFPHLINVRLKFILLLLLTFIGNPCFYELIVRRFKFTGYFLL